MDNQVSADSISRVVRAFFEAIRAMDADAWANTFAENGTIYDPAGSAPTEGRKALREFVESICKSFKKVDLTEDHVFVAGHGAAVKWTGRGTSKNGKEVKFEGIDVFEVDEAGKIQTCWRYWNPNEMFAQL